MIAVVDYCKGNLKSVERGLCAVGADARITDSAADIRRAEGIVLPGVGAFGDASETLLATGQMQAIRDAVADGVPFLGICLGEHLLFSFGEEGAAGTADKGNAATDAPASADSVAAAVGARTTAAAAADTSAAGVASAEQASRNVHLFEGLGLVDGVVSRMPNYDAAGSFYKVPHVGWNSIEFDSTSACPLLEGITPGEYFYFTHSFIAPDSAATVATTTHSVTFPSVVWPDKQVFGVQFHPEKSSDAGAAILRNFYRIVQAKQ